MRHEKVEAEIARLEASPLVRLAIAEERHREARLEYMRTLRDYERKGRKLMEAGITIEILEE